MSSSKDSHTVKGWLKIAGLITEEEEDIFGDEESEDEPDEEEAEKKPADEEEADEGEEEDTDADDEEGEEDKADEEEAEPAVPSDVVTFDTELSTMFNDFETSALTKTEGLTLSGLLLEKEIRFDVVKFTDEVANLVKNFVSLVDYEKIVIDRAEEFLIDRHDEEVAQIFIDMLADRHGIDLSGGESEPDSYATGAMTGE